MKFEEAFKLAREGKKVRPLDERIYYGMGYLSRQDVPNFHFLFKGGIFKTSTNILFGEFDVEHANILMNCEWELFEEPEQLHDAKVEDIEGIIAIIEEFITLFRRYPCAKKTIDYNFVILKNELLKSIGKKTEE